MANDKSKTHDDTIKGNDSPILTNIPNDHNFKQEHELLKEYVVRLSKELRKLQQNSEVGPISSSPAKIGSKFDRIELPKWMLDSSIMAPIFNAYDTRIQGLASFVEEQGTQDTCIL